MTDLPPGVDRVELVALVDADGNLTDDMAAAVSGELVEHLADGSVRHVEFTTHPTTDQMGTP